jgi:GT2 family glycosyltransferase
MDADDVSRPGRIAAQLAVLLADPGAVLVGTLFDGIDARGRLVRTRERSRLADLAASAAPFAHGSIMFRRDAFEWAGGYRSACDYWEDLELYWRMAAIGRLLVLPDAHYCYRFNHGHARLTADAERVERALDLAVRCTAAHGRGEDYEPLLAAATDEPAKVSPRALRTLGSIQLWSGRRPRMLKRLLSRARLRFDRETLAAFVCTVGAMSAPATSRLLLKTRHRAREAIHGRGWADGRAYEWRPPIRMP